MNLQFQKYDPRTRKSSQVQQVIWSWIQCNGQEKTIQEHTDTDTRCDVNEKCKSLRINQNA